MCGCGEGGGRGWREGKVLKIVIKNTSAITSADKITVDVQKTSDDMPLIKPNFVFTTSRLKEYLCSLYCRIHLQWSVRSRLKLHSGILNDIFNIIKFS